MKKFNTFLVIFFFVCIVNIYEIRMLTLPIFFTIAIILRVKKYHKSARLCGCFCVLILLTHVFEINNCIDKIRFPIFKPFYEKAAKSIIEEERNITENVKPYKYEKSISCIFLTQLHEYTVFRNEDIISVYFPTRVNFFDSRGYVYTEDISNVNNKEDTQRKDIVALEIYDCFEAIDEDWVYIQVY